MAKLFKTRAELLGGHYHVQVFVAPHPDQTFAGIGTLVMSEDDYDSFIIRFNATHTTKISSAPGGGRMDLPEVSDA